MSDYPDFTESIQIVGTDITLPILITACTVTFNIDIVAQTVGNIGIDIKAQTLAQLNINLAASAITLNVAIQSSAVTLNVDITAQTLAQLNVNLAASAITLNINISSQTANIGIDIKAQTLAQLNVNLAASDIVLNINVSSQTANIDVDIKAQTVGNLNIDIAAQTLGNLSVNLAASAITLNMNLQSSAITLNVNISTSCNINIKTSGGVNLVVDELNSTARGATKGIIYPYYSQLWRAHDPNDFRNVNRYGNLWRQQMVGFLQSFTVYLKNTTAGDLSMSYDISPYPGAAIILTCIATQTANTEGWVTVLVFSFWPYDSLFISNQTNYSNSLQLGFWWEATTCGTAYQFIDTVWKASQSLSAIRVNLSGQGLNLPVSGTVTAVLLPDETVKHGGVWLKPDQAAKESDDFDEYGGVQIIAAGTGTLCQRTVGAGKTDFVTHVGGEVPDETHGLILWLTDGVNIKWISGGQIGIHGVFNKPIRFDAEETINLGAANLSGVANQWHYGAFSGYEV